MTKKTILIGLGVLIVLALIGRVVSRSVGQSAAEHAIEAATGGKAHVDSDNGEMTIKTDQGTFSTSSKLPSDFPSDVPVYAGATVQGSVAAAGQEGAGHYVTLQTSDSLDTVAAWYKSEVAAKGWKIESNATFGENVVMSASKDTRSLSVSLSKDGDKTDIALVVANK